MVVALSHAQVEVLVSVQVREILVLVLVLALVHVHVRALALALVLVLVRIVILVLLRTPDDFHDASEVLRQMNELSRPTRCARALRVCPVFQLTPLPSIMTDYARRVASRALLSTHCS